MRSVVFFDFDSTIVTKESLDEVISYALAHHPEHDRLVKEIEAITTLGMEGKLPFTESVTRRIQAVPLTRSDFESVGQMLKEHITPGMPHLFESLMTQGHTVIIVSGGFQETILPTAAKLGVPTEQVLSNGALFDAAGTLVGVDTSSLLWTDAGKTNAIRAIIATHNGSLRTALVGDGANDLAAYTAGAVDVFVGFGATVVRENVRNAAPYFATSSKELLDILEATL